MKTTAASGRTSTIKAMSTTPATSSRTNGDADAQERVR